MKAMTKATPTMKAIPTTKVPHTTKAKINEYPSYPHTSGRMGAMAKDCNHRCRCFLVVVVACVFFGSFGVGGCVVGVLLFLST